MYLLDSGSSAQPGTSCAYRQQECSTSCAGAGVGGGFMLLPRGEEIRPRRLRIARNGMVAGSGAGVTGLLWR